MLIKASAQPARGMATGRKISAPFLFCRDNGLEDLSHRSPQSLGSAETAGHQLAFRCRTASNSVMIVAIATFNESA